MHISKIQKLQKYINTFWVCLFYRQTLSIEPSQSVLTFSSRENLFIRSSLSSFVRLRSFLLKGNWVLMQNVYVSLWVFYKPLYNHKCMQKLLFESVMYILLSSKTNLDSITFKSVRDVMRIIIHWIDFSQIVLIVWLRVTGVIFCWL